MKAYVDAVLTILPEHLLGQVERMHLYLGHQRTTNLTPLLAMTKEQFEAHVRAEAELIHPYLDWVAKERQHTYIAARMEHEWPLVEAGNAMATAST